MGRWNGCGSRSRISGASPSAKHRANCRTPSPRRSSRRSDRYDELPDRLAVAQRGDCVPPALERIGRADLRRDLAFGPPAEQLFDMRRITLRIARSKRSPEHAAHVAALEQGQVERELGDTRGE